MIAGEEPREQMKGIAKFILIPAAAIALFLGFWSFAARHVVANSVELPGPMKTFEAGKGLFASHFEQKRIDREKVKAKRVEAVNTHRRT